MSVKYKWFQYPETSKLLEEDLNALSKNGVRPENIKIITGSVGSFQQVIIMYYHHEKVK